MEGQSSKALHFFVFEIRVFSTVCEGAEGDSEAPFEVYYVWKSLSGSPLNVSLLSSHYWGHRGFPQGWQGKASWGRPVEMMQGQGQTMKSCQAQAW